MSGQDAGNPLSIGACAALACVLEATAPKPGNVYRGADFEDLSYVDFLVGAAIIGPIMERAPDRRVGRTVWEATEATRRFTKSNANLGIILLLAPLAKVPREFPIGEGIVGVLAELNEEDARDAYRAIRLAKPGGLGAVDEGDVHAEPDRPLVEAMQLAAERDLVARQYASGFSQVLGEVVPLLEEGVRRGWPLSDIIVRAQLELLARYPDSLIGRKCGAALAREVSDRAAAVLHSGAPEEEAYRRALADFDFWLRADGNRRNPGTTADLIAAGLFVALREGGIPAPFRFYRGS